MSFHAIELCSLLYFNNTGGIEVSPQDTCAFVNTTASIHCVVKCNESDSAFIWKFNGKKIGSDNTTFTWSSEPVDGSSSQNHTLSFVARTADNGANITCQLSLVNISARPDTVVASASALLTVKGESICLVLKSS